MGRAALPLPDSPEGRKQHTPLGIGGLAVSQQNLIFQKSSHRSPFLGRRALSKCHFRHFLCDAKSHTLTFKEFSKRNKEMTQSNFSASLFFSAGFPGMVHTVLYWGNDTVNKALLRPPFWSSLPPSCQELPVTQSHGQWGTGLGKVSWT